MRERLGGRTYASLGMPFPLKPKQMRWATYRQLRAKAGRLERAMSAAIADRFLMTLEEVGELFQRSETLTCVREMVTALRHAKAVQDDGLTP